MRERALLPCLLPLETSFTSIRVRGKESAVDGGGFDGRWGRRCGLGVKIRKMPFHLKKDKTFSPRQARRKLHSIPFSYKSVNDSLCSEC